MYGQTFGKLSKEYEAGKQVWRWHGRVLPVGGIIDNAVDFADQGFIPAGSPVTLTQFTEDGRTIHVLKDDEVAAAATGGTIAGFLLYDVVFDNGVTPDKATGAVCVEGVLYSDRLNVTLNAETRKAIKSVLPLIDFELETPETT